ncbi:hypothetical protein KP509_35G038600 [Ceratopteris richardii]|uniref:Glutaredoxin domain-containing protein n=1 Tax=Ceratopteris richardii TaxID=49495 RepID=A0A8T2QG36_CERRI|nr:hypothetical protein KP509_35G038600 [Ceratopteris richardii]
MTLSPATTTGGGGDGAWSDSEQWGNSFRQEEDWQTTITGSDALTVISNEGCCMSRVVTQLLYSLGANPRVVELAANDEGFLNTPHELPFILVGGHALGGWKNYLLLKSPEISSLNSKQQVHCGYSNES